jgi:hypothetical protein
MQIGWTAVLLRIKMAKSIARRRNTIVIPSATIRCCDPHRGYRTSGDGIAMLLGDQSGKHDRHHGPACDGRAYPQGARRSANAGSPPHHERLPAQRPGFGDPEREVRIRRMPIMSVPCCRSPRLDRHERCIGPTARSPMCRGIVKRECACGHVATVRAGRMQP